MHRRSHSRCVLLLAGCLAFGATARAQTAVDTTVAAEKPKPSFFDQFKDPEDGAFDMSQFILSKHGFLAVPIIITEPAVGYGGGVALLFMKYPKPPAPGETLPAKHVPPSVTAVIGGATENGTWFTGLAHMGIWKEDHMRYMGALARAHAVLKYYGNGGGGPGLHYEADMWLFLQQLEQRFGDSNWFYGARYLYAAPDTVFSIGNNNVPGIKPIEYDSATAGIGAMLSYDSRDNIFTPTRGIRLQAIAGRFDESLGGDFNYWRYDIFSAFYFPLDPKLVIGWKLQGNFTDTIGDSTVPFYHQPMISLRGVPAARYQGRQAVSTEAEIDWTVAPRWTLVAFGGVGRVSSGSVSDLGDSDNVYGYGVGFRYLVARRLGIKGGMDFAWSKEDTAIYIIMGSAWLR